MKTVPLTDETLPQAVAENHVVLAYFGSAWCGPCKTLAPVIEKLAADFKGLAVVGKVDVDTSPKATIGANVRSLPTLVFYQNGQEVGRMVGPKPKTEIGDWLARLVKRHLVPPKVKG